MLCSLKRGAHCIGYESGCDLTKARSNEYKVITLGEPVHCPRNLNMESPPPGEIVSACELTVKAASRCAVLRPPSQSRRTSRSIKTPGRPVPIYRPTSAAASTRTSDSKAFEVAPCTTASAQVKRSPRSPSAARTGGRPHEPQSRCSPCSRSCATSMNCSGT